MGSYSHDGYEGITGRTTVERGSTSHAFLHPSDPPSSFRSSSHFISIREYPTQFVSLPTPFQPPFEPRQISPSIPFPLQTSPFNSNDRLNLPRHRPFFRSSFVGNGRLERRDDGTSSFSWSRRRLLETASFGMCEDRGRVGLGYGEVGSEDGRERGEEGWGGGGEDSGEGVESEYRCSFSFDND